MSTMTHRLEAATFSPLAWLQDSLSRALCSAPTTTGAAERQIKAGETIQISSPQGQELLCLQGSLWITHDGSPTDHIVDGGQRYQAQDRSRMLVHALGDARVRIMPRLAVY